MIIVPTRAGSLTRPHSLWQLPLWQVHILALLLGLVLLTLGACASIPNPTSEMATARAAVDNARRAGAGQLAPVDMKDAQDWLTAAERAQSSKEYTRARRSAEQARSTAELAEEKTRLAKVNQTKGELDDTLKALRNEAAPAANPRRSP